MTDTKRFYGVLLVMALYGVIIAELVWLTR
jgi:hypothetical protein